MNNQPILVIIGPSGAGKSSVVRALQAKQAIYLTPSWTTRQPRVGEQQGAVDHVFVSEEEFARKASEGFFLEEVSLFGLPYRYGLPVIVSAPSGVATVMLRASLLPLLAKHYRHYVTYQLEDSYERVFERLSEREKLGEHQGARLEDYNEEVAAGRHLADRVFINDQTVADLVEAIEAALKIDFNEPVEP